MGPALRARTVRLGPVQLRAAARVLRRFGLLVEIHAEPSAPPPRRGKHAGIVRRVRLALAPRLRPGLVAVEGVSVEMRADADADAEFPDGRKSRAYVTPDLTVCPSQFLASDESLLHPQAVDIAVEVVTVGATQQQIAATVSRYAAAGVRALLVIDPLTAPGSWTLHTEPLAGNYWLTRPGRYGVPVPLTLLGVELPTDRLPHYAGERTGEQPGERPGERTGERVDEP